MSDVWTPAEGPELRHAVTPLRNLEFRDASQTGDGSYTFTGHAAVFDQETVLFDVGWWRLREQIATGAFTQVLGEKPDVHLNIGHDMNRAIARTGVDGIGGLELSQDEIGLRVFARLNPEDPDVQALHEKMRYRVIDQMSFAFIVGKRESLIEEDEEGNEDELRTIIEIAQLFDVCACAQGAYAQTDSELAMRSLANALGRAGFDPAGLMKHRSKPPEGADNVAPTERTADSPEVVEPVADPEAGGTDPRARRRAATQMRIRVALDD